ncbi:MAG: radical SAM protein [Elusimicrobia bacterium]|nr:radical SAM protein [Elusimicrobiota bacterium]
MRVALVQAPVWWTVDPPLGLAQIAGCARHHGHDVRVFDLNMELWALRGKRYENLWTWEQSHFWNQPAFVDRFFADNAEAVDRQVEAILKTDARVVGFSVCSGSQLATIEFARRLKSADPDRTVVLGGQYFFFGDKVRELLEAPCVDAVICGAGDESFPEFLKRLESSGELEPAPGVWIKRAGVVVPGGEPAPVRDLDAVPFADFEGFPMHLYTDPVRIPVASSRGCVWQCRFCSARSFWSGYTYMGGDRIFAEVMRHKKRWPERCHVEFYDITANGDVKSLHRFASRMGDALMDPANFIGWKINAIIRPEMTPEVLGALRRANCHDVIYGIESGSPRVLKAMNKHYSVDVADRVLRDTHGAGIVTTANFMFGFPGETEEDFEQTLVFLRRNRASLDRVYASATFTSLEDRSYLKDHEAEFGIRRQDPERFHNLYWESDDGANTYPVRLARYKRFRELAISLGVDAYKGVNGALELDQLSNLAQYHHHVGEPLAAVEQYLKYLELDLYHEPTRRHLEQQRERVARLAKAQRQLEKGEQEPLRRRAAAILATIEGEDVRIVAEAGRLALYWSKQRMPDAARLKDISERLSLLLDLAHSEVKRGEDKKPAPICAR